MEIPAQIWALIFIVIIFGLIAGIVVLYQRGKRAYAATPREGDVGFERESKLFALYQNLEDMMDGFDHYVEETRAALEMEKIDILREREETTRLHAHVQTVLHRIETEAQALAAAREEAAPPEPAAVTEPEPAPEPAPKPPLTPKVPPTGARAQTIWALYCRGLVAEEIARELGIAQNEVTLTLKVLT